MAQTMGPNSMVQSTVSLRPCIKMDGQNDFKLEDLGKFETEAVHFGLVTIRFRSRP